MKLLPRLPLSVAELEFERLESGATIEERLGHPGQIYAPVGGMRMTETELDGVRRSIKALATEHGYPSSSSASDHIAFDRRAAPLLRSLLDIGWGEAATASVWSFVSLVLIPDVTNWRFGLGNRERWIASDLTRHTWARLWWQAAAFEGALDLLDQLSESDLNQLLERRSIGGDPRLVVTVARVVLDRLKSVDLPRRSLIRDAAGRLRRRLAFVDVRSLTDEQVEELCSLVVDESVSSLTKAA